MPRQVTRREFIGSAVGRDAATVERIKQQYLAWNTQMLPMPKPS